jgi:ferredoxin
LDSSGYYAILGVSEQATYPELKRAYRRLARKYHPDRNRSSQAETTIKKINAAFEVLSDKDKRNEYDKGDFIEAMSNGSSHYTVDEYHDYNREHTNKFNQYRPMQEHKTKAPEVHVAASGLDLPKGRFQITVEPSLCLAFGSCEILAPKVFVVEKNKRINPKARIESEIGAKFESILAAAQTCPTKAIKIVDRYTGEQIYP